MSLTSYRGVKRSIPSSRNSPGPTAMAAASSIRTITFAGDKTSLRLPLLVRRYHLQFRSRLRCPLCVLRSSSFVSRQSTQADSNSAECLSHSSSREKRRSELFRSDRLPHLSLGELLEELTIAAAALALDVEVECSNSHTAFTFGVHSFFSAQFARPVALWGGGAPAIINNYQTLDGVPKARSGTGRSAIAVVPSVLVEPGGAPYVAFLLA